MNQTSVKEVVITTKKQTAQQPTQQPTNSSIQTKILKMLQIYYISGTNTQTFGKSGLNENDSAIISAFFSNIKTKISGYKQQDIRKSRISRISKIAKSNAVSSHDINAVLDTERNDPPFITADDVIEKIIGGKMKCSYCKRQCKLQYEPNDSMQWSLDRIDNNVAHTNDNTVLSCLDCNLARRTRCHYRFKDGANISRFGVTKMD